MNSKEKILSLLQEIRVNPDDRFVVRKKIDEVEKELNELEKQKDEAYRERNALVSLITKVFSSYVARHPENEEWEDDWRNIIFVELPTGQVSWHIHDSELDLFNHLPVGVNNWDGHNNKEKYKRIKKVKPNVILESKEK